MALYKLLRRRTKIQAFIEVKKWKICYDFIAMVGIKC